MKINGYIDKLKKIRKRPMHACMKVSYIHWTLLVMFPKLQANLFHYCWCAVFFNLLYIITYYILYYYCYFFKLEGANHIPLSNIVSKINI